MSTNESAIIIDLRWSIETVDDEAKPDYRGTAAQVLAKVDAIKRLVGRDDLDCTYRLGYYWLDLADVLRMARQ